MARSVMLASAVTILAVAPAYAQLGSRTGELFEFEEWQLTTPSVSGNPFDLDASVTFSPQGGGDPITTGMFYDGSSGGNEVYKFRFTGMEPNKTYNISTSSSNSSLHGKTGTITVNPNSNPEALGFLVAAGQKHAWQVGNNGDLRAIPKITYARNPETWFWGKDNSPTNNLNGYFNNALNQTQSLGYDTWWINMRHAWFDWDSWSWNDHNNVNPDLTVFRMLDNHIQDVHDRGLALDIRMWGDSAHGWSPAGLPGGINGEVDKRLQKYIADRLGALPGWSLSYAYDLEEFMSESSVDEWADHMYDNLAFPHLIWARRFSSDSSVTVASNDDRPGNADEAYADAIARFNESANKGRPVLFERNFDNSRWSHERVRRGMWAFAMAGGAAAHYADQVAPDVDTFGEFWNGQERLLLDMEPNNGISGDPDTWVLFSPSKESLVAYRRDANSIHLDLSGLGGTLTGVAVDTEKNYAEIDVGALTAGAQTINLPYASDWALQISGDDNDPAPPPQPDPGPRMQVRAVDNGGAAALDGYKTQDVVIDFDGQWTGCQLLIQLDTGDVYQDGVGTAQPPQEAFFATFASLEFDTFVAAGGTTNGTSETFSLGGGAVDLGGAGAAQFDTDGINQAWNPPGGAVIIDGTDFVVARVSLSEDSTGTWMFLASADGVIATYEGPISGGEMVPEPATMSLVSLLGLGVLIRRRRS